MNKLNIVNNTTCFHEHEKRHLECLKSSCRYWLSNGSSYNCTIIESKNGGLKQEIVGELLDLTRMRICQIEQSVLKKIKINDGIKKL